ncbi:hypothetical protein CHELA40_11703 [Chelatococcus asaccharovorans]|nr:hypothetical protein CHELA40_11703 [Chelatococcus asaccharovorans]CAH1684239.1 hypothetical protein CHELA17_63900 [Chelatococcus asaccharovorans]
MRVCCNNPDLERAAANLAALAELTEQRNARLTPAWSRASGSGRAGRADAAGCGPRRPLCRRHLPGDGPQMDRALSFRGRGRAAGPLVAAAPPLLADA